MTIIESATSWAIGIAKDQSHGYSQQNRWGPDYDCSSLVISAYKHAGVPIDTMVVNYTGNMQNLKKYGFQDVTGKVSLSSGSGLQRGDILWYHISGTNGHTAIYIGNNQIVHVRGQSYGSARPAIRVVRSLSLPIIEDHGSMCTDTLVVDPQQKSTRPAGSSRKNTTRSQPRCRLSNRATPDHPSDCGRS